MFNIPKNINVNQTFDSEDMMQAPEFIGTNQSQENALSGLEGLASGMEFARQNKVVVDYTGEDIKDILHSEMISDNNSTISLFYRERTKEAVLIIKGEFSKSIEQEMEPEKYLEICKSVGIEDDNNYNVSRSIEVEGVYVRIFALIRPVSQYPNLTISTAKNPPAIWSQQEIDPILEKVANENFVLVGASGAGKSYLLNYILQKAHKNSDKKIGIIEEFSEIFPPNSNTSKFVTPPVKPGEKSLLKFLTEQSNLMRLDYLVVGEIKSDEALPFIFNLASGTKGCCTLHGSNTRQGLQRLVYLAMLGGAPKETIQEAIAKSLKYVILVENHRIKEISELTGIVQNDNFGLSKIYPIVKEN